MAIKIAGFEAEDKIARFLSTDSVEGLSLSFFVYNLRFLFRLNFKTTTDVNNSTEYLILKNNKL